MRKLFLCLLLTGCMSVAPNPAVPAPYIPVPEKTIDDFPVAPNVQAFTRAPIIAKDGNDFKVSDEFVNNGILLKKYKETIDTWKTKHKVQ